MSMVAKTNVSNCHTCRRNTCIVPHRQAFCAEALTRQCSSIVTNVQAQPLRHSRRREFQVFSGESEGVGGLQIPEEVRAFTTTPIFKYWIQGAVFLLVLAGVDAAYSGDWSRTGVISKSFEDTLKPLVVGLGAFHIACAIIAGKSAKSKNISVVPAVLKVLAVGFLAMVEVLAAEPQLKRE